MQTLRPLLVRTLLAVFTAYHALAFWHAQYPPAPLADLLGRMYWPSNWSMFTRYTRRHSRIVVQGSFDGQWRRLPMEQWFPMLWDTGYRWERTMVTRSVSLQRAFLWAACERSGGAAEVRFVRYSWPRRLGQMDQRMRRARHQIMRVWPCNRPVPPMGRGTLL